MRKYVELLTDKERRIVTILLGLGAVCLGIFFYAFLRERPAASRLLDRQFEAGKSHRSISAQWRSTTDTWTLWREGVRDMDELKRTRLYSGDTGYQDFRLDLQGLFDAAGLSVSELAFSYADFPREKMRKVSAVFRFAGTYAALKTFLYRIERHPRLLFVEKIDFQDLGTKPGLLELQITVAGTYER